MEKQECVSRKTGYTYVAKDFRRLTKKQLVKQIDEMFHELPKGSFLKGGHFQGWFITSIERFDASGRVIHDKRFQPFVHQVLEFVVSTSAHLKQMCTDWFK